MSGWERWVGGRHEWVKPHRIDEWVGPEMSGWESGWVEPEKGGGDQSASIRSGTSSERERERAAYVAKRNEESEGKDQRG